MATEKSPEPRKRFARRPKPAPTLTDIARAGQAAGMLDVHPEPEPATVEPRKRPPHVDDEW
jgi:hypothetical protein